MKNHNQSIMTYVRYLLVIWIVSILFCSCVTYHLTTDQLLVQFDHSGTEKKVAPMLFYTAVNGNDLRELKCVDNKGRETTIPVTEKTSIRITTVDNTKRTFYFDTLLFQDSTITGSKTHFFNAHIKPIPFKAIIKIEIQK